MQRFALIVMTLRTFVSLLGKCQPSATFVNEKQSKELKKVINSYIREGKPVNEHDIAELHDVDINLLRLWKLVYSIKMDLFCFIECDDSIDCYIGGDQVS